MKNKIAGAAILVALGAALAFTGFTAWDKTVGTPKPRDIAAEFQDAANLALVEAGVDAQVTEIQCQLTQGQYGCVGVIVNGTTQEVSCGGFSFALLPDGSLPPVEDVYFEALPPDYCGLQA